MRGDMQFMLSIVYSAVIVLAIFFIFQAFVGASEQGHAAGKHLDDIGRALRTGYTEAIFIALQEHEMIFMGYVEDDACKDEFRRVIPSGNPDEHCGLSFCYCYSFGAQDDAKEYERCRSRDIHEADIAGTPRVTGDDGRGLCVVASDDGHYFRYMTSVTPTQIWLRPFTEGPPP